MKLVDQSTDSNTSFTKSDLCLGNEWTAVESLSIIWKFGVFDKIKQDFFQAVAESVLLYGCTIWTLTKRLEEKVNGNYTRVLRAVLNKAWKQHPTKQHLYGHLPPISKIILVRRTRPIGHYRTPTHEHTSVSRPAKTYTH